MLKNGEKSHLHQNEHDVDELEYSQPRIYYLTLTI